VTRNYLPIQVSIEPQDSAPPGSRGTHPVRPSGVWQPAGCSSFSREGNETPIAALRSSLCSFTFVVDACFNFFFVGPSSRPGKGKGIDPLARNNYLCFNSLPQRRQGLRCGILSCMAKFDRLSNLLPTFLRLCRMP